MFTKLSQLIRQLRGVGAPRKPQTFDLADHEIAALGNLIVTEEWQIYLKLVDSIVEYRAETLITTVDTLAIHYLRGEISAMRSLPVIIERMAKGQRDAADRSINRTEPGGHAARRSAALYSTPSWHD